MTDQPAPRLYVGKLYAKTDKNGKQYFTGACGLIRYWLMQSKDDPQIYNLSISQDEKREAKPAPKQPAFEDRNADDMIPF